VPADDNTTNFRAETAAQNGGDRFSGNKVVGIPMMFKAVIGRPPIAKTSESALAAEICP
jgi:hypothetical protein